ncbi:uncharacterized protein LOC124861636 [Girardinichthys multiradiatus]|uniref:uncharacterized protein LOC124861636 n=1 Tax=Girardinichthys multiradiatus TaxID=208333 RepID=UPI001FADEFD2|nr:uncharacterized protein LOC124861636 [Girardinichthys multiradiatus]
MTTAMAERSKTVVVSGVPEVLQLSRMVDKLTVHFQCRRRSHGGDVEVVKYPTNMKGVAFVTFDRVEDAERVVRKEQHTMRDEEFTQDYSLTVFPFSRDVFLYVSTATVDLSVFGTNQASLIKSLQSAHRSICFQALPLEKKASIEGPFSAVQALKEDLVRRASCLRPSTQTAGVKLSESPPNLRLGSENNPTSCRGTKAKLEAATSSSLSKSLQSTGKAREIQSRIPPNASLRQKGSNESLAGGSLRRADGEEIRIGTVSSSELKRLPVEKTFTKQQRDNSLQNPCRSGKIPATESNANVLKDPGGSMRNNNVSANHPRKGSALSAETFEEFWVDLYTFRYIERFHKQELIMWLEGIDMSTQDIEEIGLIRILLTEKQPFEATSRTLKDALKNLETLMNRWQSNLRVHEVFYNKAKFDKQKLIQICKGMSSMLDNVLYVFEDSSIKVIGPSVDSHLFFKELEDCMDK